MNNSKQRRSVGLRFSLRNLLVLTAIIAIGTAVGLAYRKNLLLQQERDALQSLSSHLQIDQDDQLASSAMPKVADDFSSWQVHVPNKQTYELNLGIGSLSTNGIPPVIASVPIAAGRHRITLHAADSPKEDYRFKVFVDGEPVIEKEMGIDWLPNGWSSGRGMSWPRRPNRTDAPHQLAAQSYTPRHDFGSRHYFNGSSDSYVTRQGYRLWIDAPNQSYPTASPFIGPPHDPSYQGIGMRDGIRHRMSNTRDYRWEFTRPKSETADPVLRMVAEFFMSDGSVLSSEASSFQSWMVRYARPDRDAAEQDEMQTTYTAFLDAKVKANTDHRPMMELQWDSQRPDEVGLRIADVARVKDIQRWRLRILDGSHHLWREFQVGDRPWMSANEAMNSDDASQRDGKTTLKLEMIADPTKDIELRWHSKESLPLQIVQRTEKQYAGLSLYRGLPAKFGILLPCELKPTFTLTLDNKHPNVANESFPGGPVYEDLLIDFDSAKSEWIWLRVADKDSRRQ